MLIWCTNLYEDFTENNANYLFLYLCKYYNKNKFLSFEDQKKNQQFCFFFKNVFYQNLH